MIKQLSQQTAEQLCAQQVITSLPDCIKQLVDNSIDAKATFIKIVLHEYGKAKVEVIDNGMGIHSFDFLGKKGSTSKNKGNDKFDYLGFRGEAIHSIGRVSGDMQIESKCSKDGCRRKFNVVTSKYELFTEDRLCHGQFNFQLPNREGSRNTGTKVRIQRIFQRLPVRHIELHSKFKQFLRRTNELIKEFCLIYPEIQFVFVNVREGKQQILIETVCHKRFDQSTWLQRIKELDQRIGSSLVYISHQLFEGYVLNKIESGSSKQNSFIKKNYHYLYANRRPIDVLPAIQGVMNEIYKKYNNNTKYAFIVNLKLEHQQIDLNLTPNKREIFVRKNILEGIVENLKKSVLEKVVEEIPTLNSFQEKMDKKSRQTMPAQPSVFSQQAVIEGNPRKTVYFPVSRQAAQDEKDVRSQQNANIQNSTKPVVANPFKFNIQTRSVTGDQENKKETKSTKSGLEDIELPKISVDRNRIKEQLNSKMAVSFSGVKRLSEAQPLIKPVLNEAQQKKSVNAEELQQLRKKNQENKIREEQQDAKRRENFMSELREVKLQQSEQGQGKVKMSNASKKSKNSFGGENLMEQEVRRELENEEYYPVPATSRNDGEGELKQQANGLNEGEGVDQSLPAKFKSIGNHDSELQLRIKAKLSTDMSQIFTKFNANKQNKSVQLPNPVFQNLSQGSSNGRQVKLNSQNLQESRCVVANSDKDDGNMDENLRCQLGELAPKNVKKQDFKDFKVLGQFNLGFIITHFNGRFYMVDQHAADEKYQFQRNLEKSKDPDCINCFEQREITPIQQDQIQEAKFLLQEAGFFYKILEGRTLKLERCPVFNDKKLGMDYFNQIVAEKRELQRLQGFTSICASMACRSAIKVGDPLTKEQMKSELVNLSILNSPWNCPHGRPTLIELGSIDVFKGGIKLSKEYVL